MIYKGQLILYLTDNFIICCKEHLNQSDLPSSIKNPIFLPTKHCFIEHLVQSKHVALHHDGTLAALAAVKENYWIIKDQELVRKVTHKCVVCTRNRSLLLPDLPAERISTELPFCNTGIDFADHYMCKVQAAQQARVTSIC